MDTASDTARGKEQQAFAAGQRRGSGSNRARAAFQNPRNPRPPRHSAALTGRLLQTARRAGTLAVQELHFLAQACRRPRGRHCPKAARGAQCALHHGPHNQPLLPGGGCRGSPAEELQRQEGRHHGWRDARAPQSPTGRQSGPHSCVHRGFPFCRPSSEALALSTLDSHVLQLSSSIPSSSSRGRLPSSVACGLTESLRREGGRVSNRRRRGGWMGRQRGSEDATVTPASSPIK